jgi:hypothetical protein
MRFLEAWDKTGSASYAPSPDVQRHCRYEPQYLRRCQWYYSMDDAA